MHPPLLYSPIEAFYRRQVLQIRGQVLQPHPVDKLIVILVPNTLHVAMLLGVLLFFSAWRSSGAHVSESDTPALNLEAWETSKPLSVLLVTGLYSGHLFPLVSLGEELVRRGHNVTLCANVMKGSHLYPDVPERVGIKFVSAGYDQSFTQDEFNEEHIAMQNSLILSERIVHIGLSSYIQIRAKVEEISMEHFDILVSEFTTIPVAVYFHKKGMKTVIFNTLMSLLPPTLPSWPTPMSSTGQTDDLSFLERFLNTLLNPAVSNFINQAFQIATEVDTAYKEVLEDDDMVSYPGLRIPIIYNTVLGFDFPKPRYPLVEYVGPVLMNSLPQLNGKLQEWLDSREDKTVIYISMGTTGFLEVDTAIALLDGVMATPYYAVWVIKSREQLDQVNFEAFKDRLFLAEWVPQQTVLGHKSILLSILHCGLNGVQESLFNSLPVICIPFIYDQYDVATKVSSAGVGIPLITFTDSFIKGNRIIEAETVTKSVDRIVSDNYAKNASKFRCMFKLAGGAKRAADLVEFYEDVGYDHLVPSFIKYKWSWVQYYNVDVWLVLGATCGVLGWLAWSIVRCICRRSCARAEVQN